MRDQVIYYAIMGARILVSSQPGYSGAFVRRPA
jgi:hypothetical protein